MHTNAADFTVVAVPTRIFASASDLIMACKGACVRSWSRTLASGDVFSNGGWGGFALVLFGTDLVEALGWDFEEQLVEWAAEVQVHQVGAYGEELHLVVEV